MLLEQIVEQVRLSSSQKVICDYLFQNPDQIEKLTAKSLAQATYTSPPTVTRFAQLLGFKGFDELKAFYAEEIRYKNSHFQNIDANYPFRWNDSMQKIANKVSLLYKETMDDTLALVDHDELQKAINYLEKAEVVHFFGMSSHLALGYMFQMDMTRIGRLVNVWDKNGEQLFLPSVVKENDCAIFVSYTANVEGRWIPIKEVKDKGAKIITITSLGENEYLPYADAKLRMSTREKVYSKIKNYTTEISVKYILDLLYSCLYARTYEESNRKRIESCKQGEIKRQTKLDIMQEG